MTVIREGVVKCRIDHLVVGQRISLEADPIADPEYHASGDPLASEHPEFQFEYEVVERIEVETPDCTCVYFESGFACGFPPDHEIEIDPEQEMTETIIE